MNCTQQTEIHYQQLLIPLTIDILLDAEMQTKV